MQVALRPVGRRGARTPVGPPADVGYAGAAGSIVARTAPTARDRGALPAPAAVRSARPAARVGRRPPAPAGEVESDVLSPLDDYPVHQISEPMRHVGTSDRNFYDRYYFNIHGTGDVHGTDEELFCVIGVGQYPNLGVADAFVSVKLGRRPPGGPLVQDPRAPTGWTPRSARSASRS